jgi:hypothetical protein
MTAPATHAEDQLKLSDQLESWLTADGEKTLGGLVDAFGNKSFPVLTVVLLAVPALPLPTGGVTHVFEIVAALLALELIAGRREVWLPRRWQQLQLAGARRERFIAGLLKLIRRMERISRPRGRALFHHRFTDVAFGMLVIAGSAGAFFAPPFSGLDTLPALGVVLISLGVLLEDLAVVAVGTVAGVVGVALEVVIGMAAIHGLSTIL